MGEKGGLGGPSARGGLLYFNRAFLASLEIECGTIFGSKHFIFVMFVNGVAVNVTVTTEID